MTAQNGEGVYGDGVGVVTPLAHKLSQNGPLVKDSTGKPRSGVFYAGTATLVTGKANMSYDVAAFEAAICRGRSKGTSFPTNDAVVNVATTAAPGSNSRIDVIYVQQKEVSEGDTTTEAVIGVLQGTASSSPAAPTLPDGAIELARATVPSGITATTSATITQTAAFTAAIGGVLPFRSRTERNAFSPAESQLAWLLDDNRLEIWDGATWLLLGEDTGWITPTFSNGWSAFAGWPVQYRRKDGIVYLRGRLTGGSTGVAFVLPAGFRPGQQSLFSGVDAGSATARAWIFITAAGNVQLQSSQVPNLDEVRFIAEG